MEKIFYDIKLDFKKRGFSGLAPIIVKQGDFGSRIIRAKMHIDGKPQKLENEEIILRLLRSDKKPVCLEGEIDEDGRACITLDKTALGESGKLTAEIVVNIEGYSASSQVFIIMVEPAAVSDSVINELEDMDIIHNLKKSYKEIYDDVEEILADYKIGFQKKLSQEQLENIDAVSDKADKADTLAGYGITDAYTKDEADSERVGRKTPDGGEIFNDYENNKAISPFSFAGGHDNLSGARAFTVTEVDGANNTYVLDGTEGLEIGDVYSVHFYEQRENHGKIIAIDRATNRVTVDVFFDSELNTVDVPVEEDGFDNEKNTFRIIAKPFVGTRKIGCATANFGYENQALSKGGFNAGVGNIAQGSYAVNFGNHNKAGHCAAAIGAYINALGFWSFGAGSDLQLLKDHQIGLGHFNLIDEDGKWLFALGNGKNEKNRSNALSIDWNGNAWFAGDVYSKNKKIATEESLYLKADKTQLVGQKTPDGGEIFNEYEINKANSYAHAEGWGTKALGDSSHAEGLMTTASGDYSHAEGGGTTASGERSHAEGNGTVAYGEGSHAEGCGTYAEGKFSHVEGKYNIKDTESKYAHIVGNGTSDTNCSNAHTLDWNGNAWFAGDVYSGDKKLATDAAVQIKMNSFKENILQEMESFKEEVRRGLLGTFVFRQHNELAAEFIECLIYPIRADKYGLFDEETGLPVGELTQAGESLYLPKQMAEVPLIIKYYADDTEIEKGKLIISRKSDTGYYISGEIRSC